MTPQSRPHISLQVHPSTCIKDPLTSELGVRIISGSIHLIDELGLEHFTFRKLAKVIDTTEASVYRYFPNKHKLLLYLISWYWSWVEYRMMVEFTHVSCPHERLNKAIALLTREVVEDGSFEHIDEVKLNRIVICDSSKAYLHKEVDEENKDGLFGGYKQIVACVSEVILEINPGYKYPHMLVSSVIESAHHQRYFSVHLPRLTDVVPGEDAITACFLEVVNKTIKAA